MKTRMLLCAAASALALASSVFAQGPGYGPGYGPGMTGGGMGPGMMGPGMMGGYGYGGPLAALTLADEQREKILAIQEENRRKNWDTMGKLREEMFRLRGLYFADQLDPQVYAEQQKKVDDLRREMIVSRLQARNQIEQVLNPEQRRQFRAFGPWWLFGEAE